MEREMAKETSSLGRERRDVEKTLLETRTPERKVGKNIYEDVPYADKSYEALGLRLKNLKDVGPISMGLEARTPKAKFPDVTNPNWNTPKAPPPPTRRESSRQWGFDDIPPHPKVPGNLAKDPAFSTINLNTTTVSSSSKQSFQSIKSAKNKAKMYAKRAAIGLGIALSAGGLGVGVGGLVTSHAQAQSVDKKLQDIEIATKNLEKMKSDWLSNPPTTPRQTPKSILTPKNKHVTFEDTYFEEEEPDRYRGRIRRPR